MNWVKVNLDTYERVQVINNRTGEVSVGISPRPCLPFRSSEDSVNESDQDSMELLVVVASKEPNTYELRKLVEQAILEYDKSPAVNSFTIGNEKAWLDKETRVGLVNSLKVQEELGLVESTMWLNGHPITFNIKDALELLSNLELYAIACYNVTQQHLQDILTLNREELFNYNITTNYPDPPVFVINSNGQES